VGFLRHQNLRSVDYVGWYAPSALERAMTRCSPPEMRILRIYASSPTRISSGGCVAWRRLWVLAARWEAVIEMG
jgi:hypothetical protein